MTNDEALEAKLDEADVIAHDGTRGTIEVLKIINNETVVARLSDDLVLSDWYSVADLELAS